MDNKNTNILRIRQAARTMYYAFSYMRRKSFEHKIGKSTLQDVYDACERYKQATQDYQDAINKIG